MRSELERCKKRSDDEKCAAAAKSSFELLEVQSKVRDAARQQIAKHVQSKTEAEKLANQCKIDLGKEQLARQFAEAKAFRLEQQLEKCRKEALEEESKNKVLEECLARERLRSATMRTEIHNEWKRSNELRDELYERFSDIEKLQGVVGDEADRRITAERNAASLKRQLEEEIDYRKFVEKILAKEKYRADSLDIELHDILHDNGDFEKFMVSRGAKLVKEKRSSEQTKSCALVKRVAGKLASNANENHASEVSSEETKSENVLYKHLKVEVEHLKGLVKSEKATKEEIKVKHLNEQKRVADINPLIERNEVKLRDLHYQQVESLRTAEKMLEEESEKRANAEATVAKLIHKLVKDECLISDLEDYVIGLSRRSDKIRLQLEVEIEKKETAENKLINLQQEIEKIIEELTSGEETDSTVQLSGDIAREENNAENQRNLPERKDKETQTSDFPLDKQNSSLPELKNKQTKTSEDLLLEEQQKTNDLKLMVEEEIAKRQKVEKKVLELEAMIESDENTQMEIKVLKDLCQEEAQLRRDLQADALNKNLRIEQLKMKIKMLDAEKKDVLENVHLMGACHEHGHFKEQTANHMEAVVMEEIEKRNETEKKVKQLQVLLDAKQRKADGEISKNLLQEGITKNYFEGDYLDKKFKTMLAEEIRKTGFAGKQTSEMTLREQTKEDRNGAECGEDNVDDLNAAGDGMEINCDGKPNINVRELSLKEDKGNSTTDLSVQQAQQMENNLQQLLAEEIEKRTKVDKNILELKMTGVDDKLDIVTETKVVRNLYEKEAKLRSDLEADGSEKKLMIEESITKIECLETENKQAIESSNKAQNEYFLQTSGNDELLAMLAEEIEKRIETEKKVDDLKKLFDSMEKKLASPEQNTKLGRFKMFEILLKNELERGKNVERNDGEVAMMLKLDDNASGYFKRNIGVKNCVEVNQETCNQKKDRATETSEDFASLTEEIEKRKKAEKKVLELQMIMDDDEKIDTAMEIKVWRNACEEEAKLRRDLEADGLKKKLQIEQLKMKLKVFDAEKADFKANMHKAGACIAHEQESANNVQALLAEEIKRRSKLENRVQELEMLLSTNANRSNDEEAINVFKRVAEEDSILNYFEDDLVQNEFWT